MKELIMWDEKYLTGIEIIDSQHKNIFKSVNELNNAVEELQGREIILELIGNFDFYTTQHFDTEEEYMIELDYPDYAEHKEKHETFKKIYGEVKNNYVYKFDKAVYILALHLNYTLAEWLDSHLQNEDQKLAEFLRAKI